MLNTTKNTFAYATAKKNVKEAALESVEKIEKIAQNAKDQAFDVVVDGQEKITAEVEQLHQLAEMQLKDLKQDLTQRIHIIQTQIHRSQQDYSQLKALIQSEMSVVAKELGALSKTLKEDISHISLKHKDQLSQMFKRSKQHTIAVWHKVANQ